jgi:PEP-CTERM motif-containing protein
MKSYTMQRRTIGAKAFCLLIGSLVSASAYAGTINLTYNFAGTASGPPVQSGTNLIVNNSATGSFMTGNPTLDAKWDPVSFTNHCTIDLTTGLLSGTINFVFADGDTLFGNEFENVTALVASGGTGPFTEIYTFTGGTGQFAGASGSVSGSGVSVAPGFTESGSGSLTVAAASAPEPASLALMLAGLLVVVASRKPLKAAFRF